MKKKIIVITGPTASGKTKLSIKTAKAINAQIICADSRIVYKDFDIVSAKPDIKERENIVHHLIDIVSPDEDFSAGDFVTLAQEIIDKILSKDGNIIISGGTWFYIKSLLDEKILPECKINQELRQQLGHYTNMELWEKLRSLDEKRADMIHPNNKDKVIRSIEMCIELNQPISTYQRKNNKIYNATWYMLNTDRDKLYENINKRVDTMINTGLYEEWQRNKEKYPNSIIMKNTIGYGEFFDLENKVYDNFEYAVEKIKQHTRNFAKRQLTYFRSNNNIKVINNIDGIIRDCE